MATCERRGAPEETTAERLILRRPDLGSSIPRPGPFGRRAARLAQELQQLLLEEGGRLRLQRRQLQLAQAAGRGQGVVLQGPQSLAALLHQHAARRPALELRRQRLQQSAHSLCKATHLHSQSRQRQTDRRHTTSALSNSSNNNDIDIAHLLALADSLLPLGQHPVGLGQGGGVRHFDPVQRLLLNLHSYIHTYVQRNS